MNDWKKALSSKGARPALAGSVIVALAAPAMASHFNFVDPPEDLAAAATAESFGVACAPEGTTPTTEEQGACDELVAGVATDLVDYEHPENHGKYVSFLAHCLKGMHGKGELMRQVAGDDGDSTADLAVKVCAEAKLEAERASDSTESEAHGKGRSKDEVKAEDGDNQNAEATGDHADGDEGRAVEDPSGAGHGKSDTSRSGSNSGKGGGKSHGRD
ncbi:MAG: hypothetical protein ACRDJ4_15995 [Actinomycetota bacterium]